MVRTLSRWLAAVLVMSSTATTAAAPPQGQPLMFVAELQGKFVAPGPVETAATGKAIAVLVGNRFMVNGSFSGLSSPLRDLETKPADPGVHLHRGAAGETTPYFHGLQVRLNADGRSGIFFGSVTLDAAQQDLLLTGRTYVDIHTVKFGPGEVRDQWRPLSPAAAAQAHSALIHERGDTSEAPAVTGHCHR
jgi:hypothetical protein